MASKEQIDALKAKAQELLDAVAAIPVDDSTPAASQPSAGDDLAAKLKDLQDKFDALGKERDEVATERDIYKKAIQTEIDDAKADSDRLSAAIKDVREVPVQAEVPTVTDIVPVPDASSSSAPAADAAAPAVDPSVAKPLNA